MNLDIMKERYESLPVVELRAVAKARGMKGISALRKEDLIIRMLEEDKKEENQKVQEKTETAASHNGAEDKPEERPEDNREKQEVKRTAKRKVRRAEKVVITEAGTKTENAANEVLPEKNVQENAAKEVIPERIAQESAEKEGVPEKAVQEKMKRGGRTRNGRKRAAETGAPEGDAGCQKKRERKNPARQLAEGECREQKE